jgi:hypothetical protein
MGFTREEAVINTDSKRITRRILLDGRLLTISIMKNKF